jgi:hypothetical protein
MAVAVGPYGRKGDQFGALDYSNRNAAVALQDLFKSYGLGSLADDILRMVREGFSSDVITIQLQDTPAYKQRFAANEVRRKKGLPVLSPAEYIATERSYGQVLRAAGVPQGFYDQQKDFQNFLENDVSPAEVQSRVESATKFVDSADKATMDTFRKWYTKGDLIAYALDPKRAAPVIERRFENAQLGGAAQQQGIALGQAQADELRQQGVSVDQARQGFGFVAGEVDNANKLAQISGEQGLSKSDLISEVLQGDQKVKAKRAKLASQERARFSGKSGIGKDSLSQDSGGLL